jgi:hypothetical protein
MTKAADLPLPELACAMMCGVSLFVMNMGMVRCWILLISSKFSSAMACCLVVVMMMDVFVLGVCYVLGW